MIVEVKATFACDECGHQFVINIDPAAKGLPDWSVFEIAEDAIIGTLKYTIDEKKRHLCEQCTDERAEELERQEKGIVR